MGISFKNQNIWLTKLESAQFKRDYESSKALVKKLRSWE